MFDFHTVTERVFTDTHSNILWNQHRPQRNRCTMGLQRGTPFRLVVPVLIYTICLLQRGSTLTRPYSVKLVNNGYQDVVIAIHEDVPEDHKLIDEIKVTKW